MDQLGNIIQPLIWDWDNTHIRLNRAEAVACYLCSCRGQGIEDCRFTGVWKAYDPTPKTHPFPLEIRNPNFESLKNFI
jgi:hypothetical protein